MIVNRLCQSAKLPKSIDLFFYAYQNKLQSVCQIITLPPKKITSLRSCLVSMIGTQPKIYVVTGARCRQIL